MMRVINKTTDWLNGFLCEYKESNCNSISSEIKLLLEKKYLTLIITLWPISGACLMTRGCKRSGRASPTLVTHVAGISRCRWLKYSRRICIGDSGYLTWPGSIKMYASYSEWGGRRLFTSFYYNFLEMYTKCWSFVVYQCSLFLSRRKRAFIREHCRLYFERVLHLIILKWSFRACRLILLEEKRSMIRFGEKNTICK